MPKASRSGITVSAKDVPTIIAMVDRGDRRHDIAAWFGLNQGRIKEVEDGVHGPATLTPGIPLPPSGSPGIKARELRPAVEKAIKRLAANDAASVADAIKILADAAKKFDRLE